MSHRLERLASTLRQEITLIIMRELADPRIKFTPSITRVKVSPDLGFADIYLSILGSPGEQSATLHALQGSASMIRGKLGKMLSIRSIPVLRFHIDEGLKKEIEMLELLHRLEVERKEKEALETAKQAASEGADTESPAGEASENRAS